MLSFQPFARLVSSSGRRIGRVVTPRLYSTQVINKSTRISRPLLWGGALAVTASLAFATRSVIHLDANVKHIQDTEEGEEQIVDPATSLAFPKTIRVPAKIPVPPVTLIGVGVRTVSFINIKVYSVALYADLANNNLKVPRDLTPEQKIDHIIKNTACVIRIVPTRSTGFTHLRDAFVRALNTRLHKAKQSGELTEEQVIQEGSPIRKLSSVFPNAPLAKKTAFDIFVTAPEPGKTRALVFRDFGSVESDWMATNFVLNYFGAECPSPPLKESVLENIAGFEK